MFLVRSERRVLRVLDEVIALRGERAQNVWTSRSIVPHHQAISHHHLARAVVSAVPDTTTSLAAGIAIDGAKDHLHLGIGSIVEDATTWPLSPIIRDRTVDQPERPTIIGDAATSISQIPRDRAVDHGQRSTRRVVDAATSRFSIISRDRAVDHGQRPSHLIEDAPTISVAARCCVQCRGVSECCIARDRAVDQCKCPRIVERTGRERQASNGS